MNIDKLQGIIYEAETSRYRNYWEKNQMLILLTQNDFNILFNDLSKNFQLTSEIPIPNVYMVYGFEFRLHNIENQDVLICLKHNVK